MAEHVKRTTTYCRAVLTGCKFTRIDEVQASAVLEFLAGLRQHERLDLDHRKEWYTVAEVAGVCGIAPASVRPVSSPGPPGW